MKHSFIIPTVANRENIFGIIDSIQNSSLNDYEIIVVVQLSRKNNTAILNKIQDLDSAKILMHSGIDSVPLKRNLGANASSGDILCFIDDDVSMDTSLLKFLNDADLPEGTVFFPEIKNPLDLPYPLGDHVGGKSFVSACFIIRRDDFFRNGPMNDQLLTYRDDSEFFIRAVKNGLKLQFIQNAFAWHPVRFTKLRTIKSIFFKNTYEPLFHRLTQGDYHGVLVPGRISFTANRYGFSIISYFLAIFLALFFFFMFVDPIILLALVVIYCGYAIIPASLYFYSPKFFIRTGVRRRLASLSIYLILLVVLIPSRIIGSFRYHHFTL
ncbi:MAG: glycosyltransferase family 2 protein [Thermoplasmataceae archaeon]